MRPATGSPRLRTGAVDAPGWIALYARRLNTLTLKSFVRVTQSIDREIEREHRPALLAVARADPHVHHLRKAAGDREPEPAPAATIRSGAARERLEQRLRAARRQP